MYQLSGFGYPALPEREPFDALRLPSSAMAPLLSLVTPRAAVWRSVAAA